MMKLLFIVASHGDEGFSIPVLEKMEVAMPKAKYGYDWIIGNPKALEANQRFLDADMNRSAPGSANSEKYEERRVAELITICNQYDLVIDIHGTASESGIVSIIPKPSLASLTLASVLGLDKNVIWNSGKSKVSGPLTQHITPPGIGIECGPKESADCADKLEKILVNILENKDKELIGKIDDNNFYYVYGKLAGTNQELVDFTETTIEGETFYPFLTKNKYGNISCYKLKMIRFADLFVEE